MELQSVKYYFYIINHDINRFMLVKQFELQSIYCIYFNVYMLQILESLNY